LNLKIKTLAGGEIFNRKNQKAAPPELSFFLTKKTPHRDWSWFNENKNSPWE
jgi:hypothetical protein